MTLFVIFDSLACLFRGIQCLNAVNDLQEPVETVKQIPKWEVAKNANHVQKILIFN